MSSGSNSQYEEALETAPLLSRGLLAIGPGFSPRAREPAALRDALLRRRPTNPCDRWDKRLCVHTSSREVRAAAACNRGEQAEHPPPMAWPEALVVEGFDERRHRAQSGTEEAILGRRRLTDELEIGAPWYSDRRHQ